MPGRLADIEVAMLGDPLPAGPIIADIRSLPRGESVPSPRSGSTTPRRNAGAAGASSRSKRDEILRTATAYFGENGYEATKLADVAAAVGIGSTALYHYFESKLHCLYVIMADALEFFRSEFERETSAHDDYLDALLAVLRGSYDLSEQDVLRNRVLVAEHGLVGVPRTSPREEEARTLARARIRDVEFAWATFLVRGMEQGIVPEADPRLLTRALLGLYNSIWHWYRPRGSISLGEVREFFLRRQLAVLGLPPELADGDRSLQPAVVGKSSASSRGTRSTRTRRR
jgi:TetR/AcrR family transcriptional regulator, cholesterol catabolism regulator